MKKYKIGIIGYGRVGKALNTQFTINHYRTTILSWRKTIPSRKIIKQIKNDKHNLIPNDIRLFFICTPDDQVQQVALQLAASISRKRPFFVFHLSGTLTSKVLKPLKLKGAYTASAHPIQTFHNNKRIKNPFKGIYFDLEGDSLAIKVITPILRKLKAKWVIIPKRVKPYLHILSVFLSNYFITLNMIAREIIHKNKLRHVKMNYLYPLIQTTFQNITHDSTWDIMTGPILRGDKVVINKHLKSLNNLPTIKNLYIDLGKITLEYLYRHKRISKSVFRALKKVFIHEL